MKTKKIDVGPVNGRSSYELAVALGKFNGTLEEYIDKEMNVYNNTVHYSDRMLAEMENLLAGVTEGSSLDLSELIQARGDYKTLATRLNTTDQELEIILERLNAIDPNSIDVDSIRVTGNNRNTELRNNGVTIQWRIIGELTWIDLVSLEELTPNLSIGKVETTDDPEKADVKISGTRRNPVLDFVVPCGKDGAVGGGFVNAHINDAGELIVDIKNDSSQDMIYEDANGTKYIIPAISIGTVETLEYDQPAYASISGTPTNPKLNLGIPKGRPVKVKGYVEDGQFVVIESE